MSVFEKDFVVPLVDGHRALVEYLRQATLFRVGKEVVPVRFLVTGFDSAGYRCEVGVAERSYWPAHEAAASVFDFALRSTEDTNTFNTVFLVPTGIGAEIGGHAGDSTPAARLLASNCDTLILHPNVVNASDINEAPENSLYLEGSTITRLLMGTIGVQRVRNNRILVVIDGTREEIFVNATINSVNAALSCYGIECVGIWKLEPSFKMTSAISASGRVGGRIEDLGFLLESLRLRRDEFDAVSISSAISAPDGAVLEYFSRNGTMVNPWGGVEALLTHTITGLFNIPSAHSPMMESEEIANLDLGIVDPRLAAESVSLTFVNCVLKGLQRSPKIITNRDLFSRPEVFTASNISCLVIPDGCLGIPTLAALEQGINVIAVAENRNLMKNDLTQLPWRPGQFRIARNYLEASGLLSAIRAGVNPDAVRRPLSKIQTEHLKAEEPNRRVNNM